MMKKNHPEKAQLIHSKILKIEGEYYIKIYLKGEKFNITLQAHDDKNVGDVLADQLNHVDETHLYFTEVAKKNEERETESLIAYA